MKSIAATLLAAFLLASYEGHMASASGHQMIRNLNQQVSRINQDAQVRAKDTSIMDNIDDHLARDDTSVQVSARPGYYRSVITGVASDGQNFSVEFTDRIKDGVLQHTERIYDTKTKQYQTYVVERKYADPQAEPIFNNFTTTSQS